MSLSRRPPSLPTVTTPIETPRLALRDFRTGDLEGMHAYAAREDVARFLIWGPNTLTQTRDALKGFIQDQRRRPRIAFDFAVTLKPRGNLIGAAGIHIIDRDNRTGDIGYVLHPDYWGHGFAEEAARALLHAGFRELGFLRIVAICDQRNKGSARVLERLGMRREGSFRRSKLIQGAWRDEYLYAILAEEFLDGA